MKRFSLAALAICIGILLSTLTREPRKLTMQYQSQTVEIVRGEYGIPNITSTNLHGVMFGMGYCMASDRMFQIHLRRMTASGRASQMFGDKALHIDIMFREIGMRQWAQKGAERVQNTSTQMKTDNPWAEKGFQALADGINQRVKEGWLALEFYLLWIEFQEWTVADSLIIGKLLDWSQSHDYTNEYLRSLLLETHTKSEVDKIVPYNEVGWKRNETVTINDEELKQSGLYEPYQERKTEDLFRPEITHAVVEKGFVEHLTFQQAEGGSNMWAVSGDYTTTGSPILSNDPHMQISLPSTWYQVHLNYKARDGRQVKMSAVGIPGLYLSLNKNDYCAWGSTAMHSDNQDLYKETIEGDKYLLDGKWMPLKVRNQTIVIKNGESKTILVRESHRGPLISVFFHQATLYHVTDHVSLAWTGFSSDTATYANILDFGEVDNVEKLKELLRFKMNIGPALNIFYITKDNHIGYQTIGAFPVRRDPSSGAYVKDGSSSHDDWLSIIRNDSRLHIDDPPKGYLLNCNNRASTSNFRSGLYHSGYQYTARANRIQSLIRDKISKGEKISLKDSLDWQLDVVDLQCRRVLGRIRSASEEFHNLIGFWNCTYEGQSVGATIYEITMIKLETLLKTKLNIQQHPVEATVYFSQFTINYILEEDCVKLIQQAFLMAKEFLTAKLGSDTSKWLWSRLHEDKMIGKVLGQLGPFSKFWQLDRQGSGNINTLDFGRMLSASRDDFSTNIRASLRLLFSFGEESSWIVDSGTSERPLSAHFSDQFNLFKSKQTIPIPEHTIEKKPQLNEL